jgi:hypothetical protein
MRADEVECAKCLALPGRPCRRPGGTVIGSSYHQVRLHAAPLSIRCDQCGTAAGLLCRDDDDVPLQACVTDKVWLAPRVCAGSSRQRHVAAHGSGAHDTSV